MRILIQGIFQCKIRSIPATRSDSFRPPIPNDSGRSFRLIMPVHIFGLPCDMSKIQEIARKYNLYIVEDAAEAHGSEFQGKKAGSFSEISSFSFFANKNLTTGEGGMVLTNDEALYNKARYFKNVCFLKRDRQLYSISIY